MLHHGLTCWTIGRLDPGRSRHFTFFARARSVASHTRGFDKQELSGSNILTRYVRRTLRVLPAHRHREKEAM
jgi:hypothetical protein